MSSPKQTVVSPKRFRRAVRVRIEEEEIKQRMKEDEFRLEEDVGLQWEDHDVCSGSHRSQRTFQSVSSNIEEESFDSFFSSDS